MKLGLALGGSMITQDNLRFARQAGVTHIILHLTDYGYLRDQVPDRMRGAHGITSPAPIWSREYLVETKNKVNQEGLVLEALENFNPYFWYDILLDGPRKEEQMANLQQLIRNVGAAGIPVFGYNFSIAGVWGQTSLPEARGQASTAAFHDPEQTPIPKGMIWNMVYDVNAPEGNIGQVTQEQIWQRIEYFLRNILPVAEEAGVIMAAHPDDPPLPTVRGTARLIHQPRLYQKLFDLVPSPNNQAELCVGTLAEMTERHDLYPAIERYALAGKVAYVHLRNVTGTVPNYVEKFVDEGETDIPGVLRMLHESGFNGVITPDHNPGMTCPAPWHAGAAFQLGYLKGLIDQLPKR